MNDLDLCLEVVSRSRQSLRYIWRWISRKPLEIEVRGLVPWLLIGNRILWAIEWSRDRWRHVTLKGQTRDPNKLRAQYLENYLSYTKRVETSNLVCSSISGMPSGRTNNFPESGRGLGHVTRTIFGSTVGYPSDSLASCNLSTPSSKRNNTVISKFWPVRCC